MRYPNDNEKIPENLLIYLTNLSQGDEENLPPVTLWREINIAHLMYVFDTFNAHVYELTRKPPHITEIGYTIITMSKLYSLIKKILRIGDYSWDELDTTKNEVKANRKKALRKGLENIHIKLVTKDEKPLRPETADVLTFHILKAARLGIIRLNKKDYQSYHTYSHKDAQKILLPWIIPFYSRYWFLKGEINPRLIASHTQSNTLANLYRQSYRYARRMMRLAKKGVCSYTQLGITPEFESKVITLLRQAQKLEQKA